MALEVQVAPEELKLLLEAGYLATERREFGKAKEIFEGVQALGRGADVAEVGLGNLFLVQGNAKEAEKVLRQAIKSNPQNGYAHAELGELLLTQGKPDEARQMTDKAKVLDRGAAAALAGAVGEALDQKMAYRYKAPAPEKGKGGGKAEGKKK